MVVQQTRPSDMARGPDGQGSGAGASLSDQLFNETSIGDLAREYSVLPRFDAERFVSDTVGGLAGRGLLERLDWIATCVEAQMPRDFPAMVAALRAAMPPRLDPSLTDDDFGRFIHAVPGILAVRHGLEDHRDLALDLLHDATQRFSMEFYIRPFLNRWPEETLSRLHLWAEDENYHVRRLVSEGTRPRLPWAANITIDPLVPLGLLDKLHADNARFVTRSVANHLNDLSKIAPDVVTGRLSDWASQGRQSAKELDWMTRHALRTAVKRGEPKALALLGFDPDVNVKVGLTLAHDQVRIGDALQFDVDLSGTANSKLMVDYRIRFHRPTGRTGEKVFKLGQAAKTPVTLSKSHPIRANASTFTWHEGPHQLIIQVNGRDVAKSEFQVRA